MMEQTDSEFDRERHFWIIQNVLLPSIQSIRLSIKMLYPNENLDHLADLINEVIPS